MEAGERRQKVVVVGAGPVGSLAAIYAAARGDDVEVYELRGDLREASTTPLNFTKSINLALSERGINALRHSRCPGLLDSVLADTIPMGGRMIHGRSPTGSNTEASQAYDVHGRHICAVDRRGLNKRLIDELEKMPNVKLFFHHKLTGADFRGKKAWFERRQPGDESILEDRAAEMEIEFDFLIGADGAHSATRYHLMKFARMSYSQEYIDCLWSEFTIAPSASGSFRISPNHLHIWPAGNFMFIAIPSLDQSFTCTLFGPSDLFSTLEANPEKEVPKCFTERFPGVVPDLISESDLVDQFRRNPHLPLINIKCNPHHFRDSVAILGDAANAIVPFYGQGMNAGLESVRILFSKLDAGGVYTTPSPTSLDNPSTRIERRTLALTAYSDTRVPDAHSIATLALDNYIEMRSSVTSPVYKLRKTIEESLDRFLPSLGWATQYSRVSFGNEPYSAVTAKSRRQKNILVALLTSLPGLSVGSGALVLWKRYPSARDRVAVAMKRLLDGSSSSSSSSPHLRNKWLSLRGEGEAVRKNAKVLALLVAGLLGGFWTWLVRWRSAASKQWGGDSTLRGKRE